MPARFADPSTQPPTYGIWTGRSRARRTRSAPPRRRRESRVCRPAPGSPTGRFGTSRGQQQRTAPHLEPAPRNRPSRTPGSASRRRRRRKHLTARWWMRWNITPGKRASTPRGPPRTRSRWRSRSASAGPRAKPCGWRRCCTAPDRTMPRRRCWRRRRARTTRPMRRRSRPITRPATGWPAAPGSQSTYAAGCFGRASATTAPGRTASRAKRSQSNRGSSAPPVSARRHSRGGQPPGGSPTAGWSSN